MQVTLTLSHWAKHHVRLAMVVILVLEVINGFNGVLLGATLLAELPTATLYVGTALLLIFATHLRLLYHTGPDTKGFRRWCLCGAFWGNFLLFGLVGGLLVPRPPKQTVSTGALGYQQMDIRSDTLIRPDTLRPLQPWVAIRTTGRRSALSIEEGFVTLFAFSILIALVMGIVACQISCSGYGFLAGVVSVLGLGFLAGGLYFLGRAKQKPIRDRGEVPGVERRRNVRRFWLTWAVLAGGAGLIHLLISQSYRFR